RNATMARHESVTLPASKIKVAIAQILANEGFIRGFDTAQDGPRRTLTIQLGYSGKREPMITGLQRVSKPGLRVYVQKREIPRVYGGLGLAILSTPQGVMTGHDAWRRNTGGELICYVW
ncbi:MAG TPA: 30S ribosomal protein S8, partial [Dehalococcoidia bacterium]|nr:30S ribosomal protein S8 [Dehalococcoidia bacterium]